MESLSHTFILDVSMERTWSKLLSGFTGVWEPVIWEFFANARVEDKHLNCWVRGKEFFISPEYIQNILEVRPIIPESSRPYDDRTTSIQAIMNELGGLQKKQSLHTKEFTP